MPIKHGFLNKIDSKVYVDTHALDLLIPKSYFDIGIADFVGGQLNVLGIFYFIVRKSEKDKGEMYLINTPSPILVSFESESSAKHTIHGQEDSYRVFTLNKGNVFIESDTIVQSGKNVEAFANLLHSGRLPKTTYESIYRQYIQVQEDNETSLKVPSSTLEAIIAELVRDSNDNNVPFRLSKGKDFKLINLKNLPKTISTFAGISFERLGDAIASGIERKRTGKPNVISPMEETIKL